MVAGCPINHRYSSLCSKYVKKGQTYHYSLDVPVYSAKSNFYFSNLFCALCHDHNENLSLPGMEMVCTEKNMTVQQVKTIPGS